MNRVTRMITTVLGIVLALSGINHGFFEVLQGNTPTNGIFIYAIEKSIQTWEYGGEGALTLIPNFLVSGLTAIAVALVIIVWSVKYIDTKHGASIFLLLFIALLLVGGGIGHTPFFLLTWAFATRINKPLTWWRKVLPQPVRVMLAKVWILPLVIGIGLWFMVNMIAVFGYFPGVQDPEQLMNIVFASLGSALLLFALSYIAGFAYDIEHQDEATVATIGDATDYANRRNRQQAMAHN